MAGTRHALAALVAVLVVAATAPVAGVAASPGGSHQAADGGSYQAVNGGNYQAVSNVHQQCSFPFSSVDATGTEVTVQAAPETVVTLSPSAAQTMWELGAQDSVVGVTKFATYLEGAGEKKNISGAGRTTVVVEKVVGLQPDLVLAPNVIQNDTVEKLRDSGLTVYRFEAATSLEDIKNKTRLTGELVGECEAAEQSVAEMESRLGTVREAVESSERPDVLFVFGQFGTTAGTGTFIHTAIEAAGGNNVAADANISWYDTISQEVVAQRDPEFIVLPSTSPGMPKSDAYNGTTAVQVGNVIRVDGNFISQPAPQIVKAIVTMAKAFHPDAYAEANATATPTPSPTPTPTVARTMSPMDTATPEPTATDTPGFGAIVALAALAAALLVVRRR
jgi:iron complex transport system substrate-binding protein